MTSFISLILWLAALCLRIYCRSARTSTNDISRDISPAVPERTIRASITLRSPQRQPWTIVQTMIFDSEQPDPLTTMTKVTRPWTWQKMCALVLDEFERVHTYCAEYGVVGDTYVGYRRVRKELWPLRDSFPWVHLVESVSREEEPLVFLPPSGYRKLDTLDEVHPAPVVEPKRHIAVTAKSRLEVATDGSASRDGHSGIGWACIAADGRHVTGNSRHGHNPWVAELNAIELALRTFGGPLDICTDCQPVISWIDNPSQACNKWSYQCASRVKRLLASSDSRLIWVKGHVGHPLNDKADRLARIARLDLQGMYAGTAPMIADRIAHEDTGFLLVA